ncbi:proline-, glutamic acid- and leucine-rich protein 1, partial [Ixodes scapularis]|uniref:proline-, glutamic acid- and leucine-rich protein 1 n=1 Tax=Ixodes scapularis TaxID=6945 RepID=UPI001C389F95
MEAEPMVIAAFILVLLAQFGALSSFEVSNKCGSITRFNVSTIANGSDLVCLTNTSWSDGNKSYNFSYIGNWTGHQQCLSNCNPCHPEPCTCIPGCVCLPMAGYPSVGRCVRKETSLPIGITSTTNFSLNDCGNKEHDSEEDEDEEDEEDEDEEDEDEEDDKDEKDGEDEDDDEDEAD